MIADQGGEGGGRIHHPDTCMDDSCSDYLSKARLSCPPHFPPLDCLMEQHMDSKRRELVSASSRMDGVE